MAGVDAGRWIAGLAEERRAVRVRIAGEQRWIAADEAGLYRDALGVVPPGGLRRASWRRSTSRCASSSRGLRGPAGLCRGELQARFGVDCAALLRELERAGRLVLGELRPGGSDRDWCDVDVLRRLRRASLAALRREIEPVDAGRLATFLPAWQGIDRHPRAGAASTACARCSSPCRGSRCRRRPGSATSCRAGSALGHRHGSTRSARAARSSGCGAGAHGRSGRVALYFREDAAAARPPARADEAPGSELHDGLRARLAAAPAFFSDLVADVDAAPEQLARAVWDLVWSGEATNDAWAPLRAGRLTLAAGSRRAGRRANALALRGRHARPRRHRRRAAGRSPRPLFSTRRAGAGERSAARRRSCCSSATAS